MKVHRIIETFSHLSCSSEFNELSAVVVSITEMKRINQTVFLLLCLSLQSHVNGLGLTDLLSLCSVCPRLSCCGEEETAASTCVLTAAGFSLH